jgi:hypothetical protein
MDGGLTRLALAALALTLPGTASGQPQISRDEALRLAFPGASIRSEQVFLTADQQKRAADAAGVKVPSALVARYIATRDGATAGRAYVDTHVVRTKRESLLISLDAEGRVRRVDVTAFLEPAEYRAPEAWFRQFDERRLADDVQLNRAIRPIAGATLSAIAATEAIRRALAIDRVLNENRHEPR